MARRRAVGSAATVLLARRSAILRLARRRTVLLLRGRAVLALRRRAAVPLRSPTVLLRRRRLLLRIRRVGRRLATLLWVGRVRWRRLPAALLRVRGIRRRATLRRPLRHELVALLARRRLALAGRRVALLRRRITVSRLGWRVAITVRRRAEALRRAVAIPRPGRPARRKHRAARTCVEIKFRAPHAIDAILSP